MISKIKELRQIVPIPISEAVLLLNENDGNVQVCAEMFKQKSIVAICEKTGGSFELVKEYYEKEKFDFNRTVSFVTDYLYDLNYRPTEGLTSDTIREVMQWIHFGEDKDFASSLNYAYLDSVLHTLSLIPTLRAYGQASRKAKQTYDAIFDGYTDDMPMAEFVRRHKRLDDNADFAIANSMYMLSHTVFKDELLRHLRNTEQTKKD